MAIRDCLQRRVQRCIHGRDAGHDSQGREGSPPGRGAVHQLAGRSPHRSGLQWRPCKPAPSCCTSMGGPIGSSPPRRREPSPSRTAPVRPFMPRSSQARRDCRSCRYVDSSAPTSCNIECRATAGCPSTIRSQKNDPIVLVPPLRPDVTILHVPFADRFGNVWIGRRTEFATMARASAKTLVTFEERFPGDLMADRDKAPATIPAFHVTALSTPAERGMAVARGRCVPGGCRTSARVRRAARRPPTDLPSIWMPTCSMWTKPPDRGGKRRTRSWSVLWHGCCAGGPHVAVGANSPIPGCAALLAQALSDGATRVEILGSRKYSTFSGLADLFDCACTGRLDAFFLSPGQIDGCANINMHGIGDYPRLDVRWPGGHGSPLLYMMIPNIILFRPDHRRRSLVSPRRLHHRPRGECSERLPPRRSGRPGHCQGQFYVRPRERSIPSGERASRTHGRQRHRKHGVPVRPAAIRTGHPGSGSTHAGADRRCRQSPDRRAVSQICRRLGRHRRARSAIGLKPAPTWECSRCAGIEPEQPHQEGWPGTLDFAGPSTDRRDSGEHHETA